MISNQVHEIDRRLFSTDIDGVHSESNYFKGSTMVRLFVTAVVLFSCMGVSEARAQQDGRPNIIPAVCHDILDFYARVLVFLY